MGVVESDSVKSARKAKDKLHKACERASETRERTLHGQEQNNAHAHGKHESHKTVIDFYKYNSHALLRRGFGTSVPFILTVSVSLSSYSCNLRRSCWRTALRLSRSLCLLRALASSFWQSLYL